MKFAWHEKKLIVVDSLIETTDDILLLIIELKFENRDLRVL